MQNSTAAFFFNQGICVSTGLWLPDQQNVYHERPDADDQGRWNEIIMERQRCEHHQDRPRVGPQIHGLRAGMTGEQCGPARSVENLSFY